MPFKSILICICIAIVAGQVELSRALEMPEVFPQTGHSGKVRDVIPSPDGRYIASGGLDGTSRLWDAYTGKEVRVFAGQGGEIAAIAFNPSGTILVMSSCDPFSAPMFSTIELWDVSSGRLFKKVRINNEIVFKVAFSPDGKTLVCRGISGYIIDVETGSILDTLNNFQNGMTSKYWDNGQRIEFADNKHINSFKLDEQTRKVTNIAMGMDGNTFVTLDSKHEGTVWNITSGKQIARFNVLMPEKTKLNEVILTADNKSVVASLDTYKNNSLFIWNISNGKELLKLEGKNIYALSPNRKILAVGKNKKIFLYDTETGKELADVSITSNTKSFTWNYDGTTLASGSNDHTIYLFKIGKSSVGSVTVEQIKTFIGRAVLKVTDKMSMAEEAGIESGDVTSLAFNPSEKLLVAASWNEIRLWDVASGAELKNIPVKLHYVTEISFSKAENIIAVGSTSLVSRALIDMNTGKEISRYERDAYGDNVSRIKFSPDLSLLIKPQQVDNDKSLAIINATTSKLLGTSQGHRSKINSTVFTPDSKTILSVSSDSTTRLWSASTGKEVVQFISFTDGEWISITPEGYYNASTNGDRHLNVRIGNNVYGIENYREAFFRPDLVKLVLNGGSLKGQRTLADVTQAPKINILKIPETTDKNEIMITVQLADQGGGIGDIRLFNNGSAIVLDNSRSLKAVNKSGNGTLYKNFIVKLSKGINKISAVAFNSDNSMQSNAVEQIITSSFASVRKPVLHALVIGIQEFKNPKLALKYSVADATLFAEALKNGGVGLFEETKITRLTTKEATSRKAIIDALNKYQSLNPDDLFIFYVASHGTVDDGEYFLITSNVGSTNTDKLKTDALSQNDLKGFVANIPSTKKMIVIDTCNAGKLGEGLQAALLTRGMSDDTAMKILSRAVGVTILSAATSVQEALEGHNGHGLFTWVLVEGLKGKADKGKSGYVKTLDLASYVDDEVPVLAEKLFNRAQYPTTPSSGQSFPIGRVQGFE